MPVLLSAAKIPVELASFRPGCALPAGRPEPVAALGRFAGAPKDEKRKLFGRLLGMLGLGSILWLPGHAAQAGDAPLDVVKVFLLSGQSNMSGRAPSVDLPERYRVPPPKIQYDYACSFGAGDLMKPEDYPKAGGLPEPHRSPGWVALQPSPKHLSTPGEHFGPEIGFGHALAARWPGQNIAIIKHGRGATNLAEEWAPEATSGRRLYQDFLAQVRTALARFTARGVTFEICALVWSQGEADSTERQWAEAYERNLTAFFARVRRDLNLPGLPMLVALTGDGRNNPRMLFSAEVRRAQRAVVARDPHAALVTGDDLALLDHTHYDAAGQITLGERLAEAYLKQASAK